GRGVHFGDGGLDVSLQILQPGYIPSPGDKGNGHSGSPCPTCSTDTVNIIFFVQGQIIVEYHLYIIYVYSTGCYIGSYQYGTMSFTELVHYLGPLRLG